MGRSLVQPVRGAMIYIKKVVAEAVKARKEIEESRFFPVPKRGKLASTIDQVENLHEEAIVTTLTFYTNPQVQGQRVRWMLEEQRVPYERMVFEARATRLPAHPVALPAQQTDAALMAVQ